MCNACVRESASASVDQKTQEIESCFTSTGNIELCCKGKGTCEEEISLAEYFQSGMTAKNGKISLSFLDKRELLLFRLDL